MNKKNHLIIIVILLFIISFSYLTYDFLFNKKNSNERTEIGIVKFIEDRYCKNEAAYYLTSTQSGRVVDLIIVGISNIKELENKIIKMIGNVNVPNCESICNACQPQIIVRTYEIIE